MKIYIATQFSRRPGPRYKRQGDYSAEEFREKLLVPNLKQCLQTGDELLVVFDGIRGVGVSFLEEAFGGLIRRGFSKSDLECLKFQWSLNPEKIKTIQKYIDDAANK